MAGVGDNSVDRDKLKNFVERIERLADEKDTLATVIREVYGEAKAVGFDMKILRRVIALRKIDNDSRKEAEAVLDLYLSALGML